jgi:hypothetical protein
VLASGSGSVLQDLCGVHVVAQTETTSSFLRNGELITSSHLDLDTKSRGIVDGLLGIFTGRVEDGEETDELETVTLGLRVVTLDFLESDGQGTETTHCEFLNISLKPVLDIIGLVAGAELDNDAGHTLSDALEFAGGLITVGTLGTLVNGVEWLEVKDLDTGMGLGRIRD